MSTSSVRFLAAICWLLLTICNLPFWHLKFITDLLKICFFRLVSPIWVNIYKITESAWFLLPVCRQIMSRRSCSPLPLIWRQVLSAGSVPFLLPICWHRMSTGSVTFLAVVCRHWQILQSLCEIYCLSSIRNW